jgi:glucose 1-dehydrogenase/3-oxoacyl-[acyl-carrier protein] reductase
VFELTGQVAIITGAAAGIGEAIARRLARAGARVGIADIDLAAASDVAGSIPDAFPLVVDITQPEQVREAIAHTLGEQHQIDILVNNAGIETIIPFLEISDEQWTRVTDVDLRAPWLCSQVFCRRVIAEGRKANIVNIGSVQAAKILPGRTHYAPAKLAIEALTRNTSAEMTPLGIRVNCVHPGFIATDMTSWIQKDPAILSSVVAQISVGRAGEPRDIGKVAAFFASDESDYVTGQSIHVDGGWIFK